MSYVQDSFGFQDGCIAHIHRPTQGWMVREYILPWQSKQASPTVQPWVGRWRITSLLIWRPTGSAEGAYISLRANWFPLYTDSVLPSTKGYGSHPLNWLLPSQKVINIMDEEVDESDEPALMCELYRCKEALTWTLIEYYELDVCPHNIGNNQETSGLLLVSIFCNIQRTP